MKSKYSLKKHLLSEGANYSSYEDAMAKGSSQKEFISKGAEPFPEGLKILYSNSPSGKWVYDQRTKRFYTSTADGQIWDEMQAESPKRGMDAWRKMYGLMKNLKGANAEEVLVQRSGGKRGSGRGAEGDVVRDGKHIEGKSQIHPTKGLPIPILKGEYSDAKLDPAGHCKKYFDKRGGSIETMDGKVYTFDMFDCANPARITNSAVHVKLK